MAYPIVTKEEFKQFVTLVGIIVEKEKELGRYSNIDEYKTTFIERLYIILNEVVKNKGWTQEKIRLCFIAIMKIRGMSEEIMNGIQLIEYKFNWLTNKNDIYFHITFEDDIKEI